MDSKLPAHTEADNVHASPYGIIQKCMQHFQLLSLNNMHIMIVKELKSQLTMVPKKVVQSPELKTTVSNQASVVHTAVPAKGSTYNENINKTTDPLTRGVGSVPISYTFSAPGTAALCVLDQCFDANSLFSAIMLLVKAGHISADSMSLKSSLQAVADYDTEVCLFFTLPNSTLNHTEMDQAKDLADVLLTVLVVEVVLLNQLTDMITKHDTVAKTADKLQQYIINCMSSHRLCPGMRQEAYMAQAQGLLAMSVQHMPTPVYSPSGFVLMSGAQGYHTLQLVQQLPPTTQYALQLMQQAHMVQQAHEMQCVLYRHDFEGDNFIDVFSTAQCQHMQCSNCNTYKNMFDPLCDYVLHDTLNCLQKCNMCKKAPPEHLGPADNERRCIRFDGWQHRLEQRPVQRPPQQQQQQRQGGGHSADYSQRGITGARKTGRPSCLREGASEAAACRVADFDIELARMASAAVSSLDDPTKLAEIDACYDSTFHMHEEHVHMANTSGAGP